MAAGYLQALAGDRTHACLRTAHADLPIIVRARRLRPRSLRPRRLVPQAVSRRGRFASGLVYPWEFTRGGETLKIDPPGQLVVGVGEGGLVPARPLEKITLEHVRKAVLGVEATSASIAAPRASRPVPATEQHSSTRPTRRRTR